MSGPWTCANMEKLRDWALNQILRRKVVDKQQVRQYNRILRMEKNMKDILQDVVVSTHPSISSFVKVTNEEGTQIDSMAEDAVLFQAQKRIAK